MLAAVWLAQGYDSEELRELAGLTRQEGRQEARLLLPRRPGLTGLATVGRPAQDQQDAPWLGYWSVIAWARDEMDRLLAPYAAAQKVIEVAGFEPDLWVPAGADRLVSLLRDWDDHRAERQRIDDQIREHLRSLREEDAPRLGQPPVTTAIYPRRQTGHAPITEANFVRELVAAVPETRDLVTEHLRDNFGELLLHLLMADLLRFAVKNFRSGRRASSQHILAFVDRALRTGDAAVENAVAVSFVEHIGAYPGETPEFIASWPLGLQREKDRQNHWPRDP